MPNVSELERLAQEKEVPSYDVTSAIIDYESGLLDWEGTVALFQYLVDTGMAWQLQGSYGRAAQALINAGEVRVNNVA